MQNGPEILVVNTHPIQYFAPLYRHIGQNTDMCLTAIYIDDFGFKETWDEEFQKSFNWDIDLRSGFSSVVLNNYNSNAQRNKFWYGWSLECFCLVHRSKASLVWLHGYNNVNFFIAWIAAILSRKKIALRGESNNFLIKTRLHRFFVKPILKIWFKSIDYFFAIGSANSDYYVTMGVEKKKIIRMPYCIDNSRFMIQGRRDVSCLNQSRAWSNIDDDTVIIVMSSKFIPRKNILAGLEIYSQLERDGFNTALLIIGDGPLRDQIETFIRQNALATVILAGFINQSEIANLFRISDIFWHFGKQEPWGLVVNEAAAAGLPLIVERTVGSAQDLVVDGVTGFQVDSDNRQAVYEVSMRLVLDGAERRRLGSNARQVVLEHFSFEVCAAGLKRIVHA